MKEIIWIFFAGFATVFRLGFQSRNVNHGHYAWAAATSFIIAIFQASLWMQIARPGVSWAEIMAYGLSGMLGITSSMWIHQRFVMKRGKP